MSQQLRREFLTDMSRGMLAAGLGASLAADLGFSTAFAAEGRETISLGEYESLVELIRETPADKLQPAIAKMLLRGETNLKQLTAAAALANAVTFGGCDYVGFHTAMAMIPALEMSRQLEARRQPLPVLKVLYRNAQQIQSVGAASPSILEAVSADDHDASDDLGLKIRDACRRVDVSEGEKLLAVVGESPLASLNSLQLAIQDDLNVHRFVFAHRTHGLADLLGGVFLLPAPSMRTVLRESRTESNRWEGPGVAHPRTRSEAARSVQVGGKDLGKRDPGDATVEELSRMIYEGPREHAAEVAAGALADGVDPEIVGEAISLASNRYVLRQGADQRRVHGDSAGVHSSDATNAWRNMARVVEPRHAVTGLIVAAYHAGVQSAPFATPAFPTDEQRASIQTTDPGELLAEADDAIRQNDQGRAAAAIEIYGEQGHPAEPVFRLMLKYTVSEDGRLHGEKYYHTVREEYRTTRPAFRWRHVMGLARVTASAYGYNREDQHGFRAAGYDEACKLLGVES